MTAARLSVDQAVAHAQERYTLAPEEGWRFVNGATEQWAGWRVSFTDRRSRPRKASFLLYNDQISRDDVATAIDYWFRQVGR